MSDDPELLMCHSYDSVFSIRKRVRRINDIQIPLRQGLATQQIGAGIIAFIFAIISYGLVLLPLMRLFGIKPSVWIVLIWLLGLPILAGQQIAKPMPYGKSIPGSIRSFFRFHLDDRVHRRGLPVKTPPVPADVPRLHYQREWVISDEYSTLIHGDEDFTDADTERWMGHKVDSPMVEVVDLQPWYDGKALDHLNAEREAARKEREEEDLQTNRRGYAPGVVILGDDEDPATDTAAAAAGDSAADEGHKDSA